MTGWSLVIAAGLVNWLATTIVVESELARPVRDFVCRRRHRARPAGPGGIGLTLLGLRHLAPDRQVDPDRGVWHWLDYLLRCHLCVGVWVAIAEVLWLGPIVGHGAAGYAFTALMVKATGHLVLELRPQAWRP